MNELNLIRCIKLKIMKNLTKLDKILFIKNNSEIKIFNKLFLNQYS